MGGERGVVLSHVARQVKLCNCSRALITCSTKVLLASENTMLSFQK